VILAALLLAALPTAGTQFHELPDAPGRAEVEAACYTCHSADLLVQQHLTEKQWTAAVEKMMRWGAALDESNKSAVIAYLFKQFGPDHRFTPLAVAPMPKPVSKPSSKPRAPKRRV
jgi:hypothetical protein